jgi:hypothetical protein
MAVDTPARIAILGAGPIGLEAALYARFLGYDVDLYERGRVAEHLQQWGQVRLFSPWSANVSPLGIQALSAQDANWKPAPDDALLAAREFVDRYYLPLSQSDLIVDSLRLGAEVIGVGRERSWKLDAADPDARIEESFRILTRDPSGAERVELADVVIDTTGVFGQHNWAGQGGLPAMGELALAERIEYGLPDVAGAARDRYAGRRVLVVGGDYCAAINLSALAGLEPRPQLTWVTRSEPSEGAGPIETVPNDPFVERARVVQATNGLASNSDPLVSYRPGSFIERIESLEPQVGFRVTLAGMHPDAIEVDEIIANVGYRPDRRLYEELHVHECYVTEGPRNVALAERNEQAVSHPSGPASLINPEPDFYILGAKSFGRDSRFLLSDGLAQIRDLFTVIGDRANLDLYANMRRMRS